MASAKLGETTTSTKFIMTTKHNGTRLLSVRGGDIRFTFRPIRFFGPSTDFFGCHGRSKNVINDSEKEFNAGENRIPFIHGRSQTESWFQIPCYPLYPFLKLNPI
jgi:hypothetical protein